ncbi:antitoxin Xre/MbcA/ParS toxin-binding domain-containing protein [uncultured Maribacter sp.]|uniref:type II RES/Xre toxin-antitoxin system antitoxin n=1 Tax=uncultured Maribacter sp. TaxID=431308 RepID=UPI0030EB3A9B|tara:strand:+ start:16568 stop:17302 length:735 start_codon:yes stop_codon:yes gene_type:complete
MTTKKLDKSTKEGITSSIQFIDLYFQTFGVSNKKALGLFRKLRDNPAYHSIVPIGNTLELTEHYIKTLIRDDTNEIGTSLNEMAKSHYSVLKILAETMTNHAFKNIKESEFNITYEWNDDSRAIQLLTLIKKGFDYKTFLLVTKNMPFNDNDWANILDTTTRTLDRYKKDNKSFSSTQTEKIIEIQQLMKFGAEVFGDITKFNNWLVRENSGLGNIIPKTLLDTSIGIGLVKDSLGRIEHGIFA